MKATGDRSASRTGDETRKAPLRPSGRASAERLLELHPRAGNQAVMRLVQARLLVGQSADPLEREADQMASQVMRVLAEGPTEATEHDIADDASTAPVRRSSSGDQLGGLEVDASTEHAIGHAGSGSPLPSMLRTRMESAFGADFSTVRLHHGPAAEGLSRSLQAEAFTTGRDIFFGRGAYRPGTPSGQELLAHELTHVVQQGGGHARRRCIQRRFGMEVELPGVLLTSLRTLEEDKRGMKAGDQILQEPDYDPGAPKVGESASGRYLLHADHSSSMGGVAPTTLNADGTWAAPDKGAILELVTTPIDEFVEDDTKITDRFTNMAKFAEAAAGGSGKQLSKIRNAKTSVFNYVGVPRANVKNPALRVPRSHANGSLQATYGVKLERLPDILDLQADPAGAPVAPTPTVAPRQQGGAPPPPSGPGPMSPVKADSSQQVLAEARQKAASVTALLLDTYGTGKAKPGWQAELTTFSFADQSELKDVQALIALLLNYLLAGKRDMGFGWGKNFVGQLFYKSRLSSLRNSFVGPQHELLEQRTFRIALQVISTSGRAKNDYVIQGRVNPATQEKAPPANITCQAWVREVLEGRGDTVFDSLKNEYADEIKPEKIGAPGNEELAVIMENRHLGKLVAPKVSAVVAGLDSIGTKPDDWAGLAVKLAQMLRIINGVGPPDLDNVRALLKA
ncbi:MAG TPA: DUF4157 domain-containing protein [Acidimicrobiales bacterium]|nr:DUF4157 domain-containing protein [Acidimicrobiales bacterium]